MPGEVFVPFPLSGQADDDANQRIIAPKGGLDAKIVRQSKVSKVFDVQPESNGTGGNTRFAVAHGLGDTPDFTTAYVRSVEATANAALGSSNAVGPAAIMVNNCHPYADSKLSYFTVCLTLVPYATEANLDAVGSFSITFNAKWGRVISAFSRGTIGSAASPAQRVSTTASTATFTDPLGVGAAFQDIAYIVYFGMIPNTRIEIECLSEIREVWSRNIRGALDGLAHPVP